MLRHMALMYTCKDAATVHVYKYIIMLLDATRVRLQQIESVTVLKAGGGILMNVEEIILSNVMACAI